MKKLITKKHLLELWDEMDQRGKADMILLGEAICKAIKDHPECSTEQREETVKMIREIHESRL